MVFQRAKWKKITTKNESSWKCYHQYKCYGYIYYVRWWLRWIRVSKIIQLHLYVLEITWKYFRFLRLDYLFVGVYSLCEAERMEYFFVKCLLYSGIFFLQISSSWWANQPNVLLFLVIWKNVIFWKCHSERWKIIWRKILFVDFMYVLPFLAKTRVVCHLDNNFILKQ